MECRKGNIIINVDRPFNKKEQNFIRYMVDTLNAVLVTEKMDEWVDRLKPIRLEFAEKFDKEHGIDTSYMEHNP